MALHIGSTLPKPCQKCGLHFHLRNGLFTNLGGCLRREPRIAKDRDAHATILHPKIAELTRRHGLHNGPAAQHGTLIIDFGERHSEGSE